MPGIYILTEGGDGIGMGHISRCLSLCQAFDEFGYAATLIINNKGKTLTGIQDIRVVQLDWLNHEQEILSMVNDADILLIDSYMCTESLYQKLAHTTLLAAYIDDSIRINYPPGIVINGVMCAEEMRYPKQNDVQYLLGQEYAFLRKEFWKVPDKKINKTIKSVLITCGGNDDGSLSYSILRCLVEKYPGIEKKLVLKNRETVYKNYFNMHATVLTDLNASDMRVVMTESDIAITASGQTTYELSKTGTPFIAITTAENQLFSIGCFYRKGLVGTPIDAGDTAMCVKILEQMAHLADQDERRAVSNKMKENINGQGSLKIVQYLIQTLQNKSFTNDTRRN